LAGRVSAIDCQECGEVFPGDRTAARRASWEPFSSATQAQLDSGPMMCPACISAGLTVVMAGMRRSVADATRARCMSA